MFNVIIADDERIQREGIKKHVEWHRFDMNVIGLAEHGAQALELMKLHGADFIITDVKMPHMDGLTLAEKALELNPNVKIMIISGYDEFEYVRTALELNAYAYLLKPINIKELNNDVEKISLLMQQETENQHAIISMQKQLEESKPLLIEKLFVNIFYDFISDTHTIHQRLNNLSLTCPTSGFKLLILQIDESAEQPTTDVMTQLTCLDNYKKLKAYIENQQSGYVIQTKETEFVIISYSTDVAKLTQYIRSNFQYEYEQNLTIGISTRKYDLSLLREAYKECEAALKQKFFMGKGKDIHFLDHTPQNPTPIDLDIQYNSVLRALERGDMAQVEISIDDIFNSFHHVAVDKTFVQSFCFKVMSDLFRILHETGEKIEEVFGESQQIWSHIYHFNTLPEIRDWLREMAASTCELIHTRRIRKDTSIIESITQILESRYDEQITVDDLAKQVYLTPNYISNIFKENIGEGIIEYLTKIRMKHAIRLLSDESLRVYEIAEQCGYNSTSYFSVVFKNMYGISPKEYRDSVLNRQQDR